ICIPDQPLAHLWQQMNYQQNANDLGKQEIRVSPPAKFAIGVSVVGGQNDDAVVVKAALPQEVEKFAERRIHPAQLINAHRLPAAFDLGALERQRVHVLRLSVGEDWFLPLGSRINLRLQFLQGRNE